MADIWMKFKQTCPDYVYTKDQTLNPSTQVLLDFFRYILSKIYYKVWDACSALDSKPVDSLANIEVIKHINDLIPANDFKLSFVHIARSKEKKVTHIVRYLMHLICVCFENADDFNILIKRKREQFDTGMGWEQERQALLIVNHDSTIEEMKMREAIKEAKTNLNLLNKKHQDVTTSDDFKGKANNIRDIKSAITKKNEMVEKLKESVEMHKELEVELNEVLDTLSVLKEDIEDTKENCDSLDNIISLKQKEQVHLQSVSDIATTFSNFVKDLNHIVVVKEEVQKQTELNADLKSRLQATNAKIAEKVKIMNEMKEVYIQNYKKQLITYQDYTEKLKDCKEESEQVKLDKAYYLLELEKYMLKCEMMREEISSNECEFNKQVKQLRVFEDTLIQTLFDCLKRVNRSV